MTGFPSPVGAYYNFFSAPGISVNVKTEDATFTLHNGRLTVDGSFITEAPAALDLAPPPSAVETPPPPPHSSQAHLVAGAGVCPPEAPPAKCAGAHKKLFNVSYLASELTEQNAGFSYLRGTCGGGTPFQGGMGFTRRCEDILVQSHFSSANITVRGWTFVLRGIRAHDGVAPGLGTTASTRCRHYAL